MQNISKINFSCVLCETEKKNSNVFYYCSYCYKFYCLKHGETHNLKEGHKIFFSKILDSSCTEHNGNTVVGYCENHNKNYCVRCNHFNENIEKLKMN